MLIEQVLSEFVSPREEGCSTDFLNKSLYVVYRIEW